MRINEAISVFMALLVFSASFVTICDAGEFRSAKVHLIAKPCDNHECSRNAESHDCTMDERPHEICKDRSSLGEFITSTLIHVEVIVPAPSLVIGELFESVNQPCLNFFHLLSPILPSQRSTVLRV